MLPLCFADRKSHGSLFSDWSTRRRWIRQRRHLPLISLFTNLREKNQMKLTKILVNPFFSGFFFFGFFYALFHPLHRVSCGKNESSFSATLQTGNLNCLSLHARRKKQFFAKNVLYLKDLSTTKKILTSTSEQLEIQTGLAAINFPTPNKDANQRPGRAAFQAQENKNGLGGRGETGRGGGFCLRPTTTATAITIGWLIHFTFCRAS